MFVLVVFTFVFNFFRMRKMRKDEELRVKVVRGGECSSISVSDLQEGDLIRLSAGDTIPADGILASNEGLMLDSALEKRVHTPFHFSGYRIVHGSGTMIVVSVGKDTELEQLLRKTTRNPNEETLLQARVNELNKWSDRLSFCISVVIFVATLVHFIPKDDKGEVGEGELGDFAEGGRRGNGRRWKGDRGGEGVTDVGDNDGEGESSVGETTTGDGKLFFFVTVDLFATVVYRRNSVFFKKINNFFCDGDHRRLFFFATLVICVGGTPSQNPQKF